MAFDPIIAETRFGCGLSPVVRPPETIAEILDGTSQPSHVETQYPIASFDHYLTRVLVLGEARKKIRAKNGPDKAQELRKQLRVFLRASAVDQRHWLVQSMLRRSSTDAGFRERLAFFWADHFTAKGKRQALRYSSAPYAESAIRPHLTGRFEDMLIAAVTHPLMLSFLDQEKSVGPASPFALKRQAKQFGLNENLAREVLELHTLGVAGPYSQTDVRQLAELFAGLQWKTDVGLAYRPEIAEPGAERVLGKWYGSQQGQLADIHAVLRDLARHPSTARHIAHKLAVHFVSDAPDDALVRAIEAAYLDTDGHLPAVYHAMLSHTLSWQGAGNVKQPVEFVGSSLRALGFAQSDATALEDKNVKTQFLAPLLLMGQPWEGATGPDGWSEDDQQWASPQGLAARPQWALSLPEILPQARPDPREFVRVALGPDAPERVVFAAGAAESRREGIALVLMSPAFQRH
ncbi:DUF1800 domain-containing protein [uncultured Shimia sp.]|uniref:DUF1800 domain-containing protein n=1 Tax=uncultured Shimia sp. TaxID=573152 RepID=UPI00262DAA95|nr:DUF1800 domain-containing protein [uncultured Shimia sp.]